MWAILVLEAVLLGGTPGQVYEDEIDTSHPAIRYWRSSTEDPISRLVRELESGSRQLEREPLGDTLSYLPSLLRALGVPVDSQTLVFSKTSFQKTKISPRQPRAIYFADDVAVGFSPTSELIEVAAVDPRQGVLFYTVDADEDGRPRFLRPEICLECHDGPATLGVPGLYVGSVRTTPSGRADFRLGSVVTDHRTPFVDRWGGWYVSGTHGESSRAGTVFSGPDTRSLTRLTGRVAASDYTSPVSDIVALMTLEHQTQMTNLITRLGWEARINGAPSSERLEIDELVRYMLFVDEAPLSAPIRGVSTFTKSFPLQGPRDGKGRSLRDFDLETRLFRYPLSYMIYSDAFGALPKAVRERVYRHLHERLTGGGGRSDPVQRAILAIVRETKNDVPAFWQVP